MEALIQIQNIFNQDIIRLEVQISQVTNTYKNEETLPYQSFTDLDISNAIDLAQESWCFGNQDSISAHPFELDQNQNFKNYIELASYPF